jgi:hypothetical protein
MADVLFDLVKKIENYQNPIQILLAYILLPLFVVQNWDGQSLFQYFQSCAISIKA